MRTCPLLLALFAAVSQAGTIDDNVPDRYYIHCGAQFAPFVRKLVGIDFNKKPVAGTAVIIAPRWALTAAHLVDEVAVADVSGNRVRTVFLHPKYEQDACDHQYDIAAVLVESDFGLDFYIPYAERNCAVGDLVTIVGYGSTGKISKGHTRGDGLLRAGTQTIEGIEGSFFVCKIMNGSSPMEIGIAPGDSGGPVYYGDGTTTTLIGINSNIRKGSGESFASVEGNESRHTNVTFVDHWLDEVMLMANDENSSGK